MLYIPQFHGHPHSWCSAWLLKQKLSELLGIVYNMNLKTDFMFFFNVDIGCFGTCCCCCFAKNRLCKSNHSPPGYALMMKNDQEKDSNKIFWTNFLYLSWKCEISLFWMSSVQRDGDSKILVRTFCA